MASRTRQVTGLIAGLRKMGKEMVICPDCGKEVKSQGLAAHRRIVHEGLTPGQGKQEAPQDTASITAPKTITLSGEDLGVADMLLRSGFAKDLNELTHKSLNFTNSNINRIGGIQMEQPKKEETLEDIDKMRDRDIVRKFKEQQLKSMEKDLEDKQDKKLEKKEPEDEEEKILKQMERSARIKAMKKALDEGDFSLSKMMEMRMMDKMFGGSENSGVQALQNQILQMQNQLQQERLVAAQQLQNERVLQKIEQMGNAQPGMTAQDVLAMTAREQTITKEADIKLQEARDKLVAERFNQLQLQMQQAAQQGGGLTPQKTKEFLESINAIKELSAVVNPEGKEKGIGEFIGQNLTNLIPLAKDAMDLGKRNMDLKQQEMMMQAQNLPAPIQNPQMQNPEFQPPQETEQFPEQFPPQPEMSLQQQMDDTMTNMYIKKKK